MRFNWFSRGRSTQKMGSNNWDKFCLLMWKNWTLQWNHKIQLVLEIALPTIFSLLLVLIRTLIDPDTIAHNTYHQSYHVTGLHKLLTKANPATASPVKALEIVYSPNNTFYNILMNQAGIRLTRELNAMGVNNSITAIGQLNGEDVEKYVLSLKAIAGIVFEDDISPKKLSYSLRFPSELRFTMQRYTETWHTDLLYPIFDVNGPQIFSHLSYTDEGFAAIQHAISSEYINLLNYNNETIPEIMLQQTPYPPYIFDPLIEVLKVFVSLIILLSFSYPTSQTIKYITTEKEKKLKEIMKIMGLPNWLHWTAWFVKTFILMISSVTLIVILLKINWKSEPAVAVFTHSDWSVIWFFFMAYTIATITFCFMLATFFSKANTAAAVSGLIWFIVYLPYLLTQSSYGTLELFQKLLLSLLVNTGMAYGFSIIVRFEGTGEGLQWSNLFRSVNIDDDLSVGLVIIVMLVASVIHMLITLYLEKIYPGEYGVPEKWYFPFTSEFWRNCFGINKLSPMEERNGSLLARNPDAFESEPLGKHVGVSIKKIKKKFGDKVAVDELSMNMYEDEITALLGHNGAGKTTTISMLIGMFPPSSGTAIINGYDIRTNLASARHTLGVCPQHNILFDELTVKEHIIFYSRLKGLSGKLLDEEIKKYLRILQLESKINTMSKKLSGGMKRKLSVCAALCGNSKVVLLDEPSSGMDPAARRSLWDLIQAEKTGRTLLISTHFMDEADVLGDRIAIMCNGELKCYGTSFFLKKKFGVGYHLICVKGDNCESIKVTNLLSKYIPDIRLESEIGSEMSYQLPDKYSHLFEEMLSKLENASDEMHLNGYGISITTLEEVFMQVGVEKQLNYNEIESNILKYSLTESENDLGITRTNIDSYLLKGFQLTLSQWKAMLLKKVLYLIRNMKLLIIQNFLPIFFIVVTILVARRSTLYNVLSSLDLNLTAYGGSVTIVQTASNLKTEYEKRIAEKYENIIKKLGTNHELKSISTDFSDYFIDIAKKILITVNSEYLIGASVLPNKVIAWYNSKGFHTVPITLNNAHNAILRALKGDEYEIKVTNYPLPFAQDSKLAALDQGNSAGFSISLNLAFCFAFVSAFYILFLIKERVSKAKLLQFVSGIRVFIFWFSQFAVDYLTFLFTAIVTLITLACFQEEGFATGEQLGHVLLLTSLFGLAFLPIVYLTSMFFTESATGFSRLSIINIFTGMALFVVVFVLKGIKKTKDTADTLHYVFLLFPHYAFATGLNSASSISIKISQCLKYCDLSPVPIPNCDIELICHFYESCCPDDYFTWNQPGILANIIYMFITSGVGFAILLIKEYRLMDELLYGINNLINKSTMSRPVENPNADEDVKNEKLRINAMSDNRIQLENLVLQNVTKFYKNFLAVNQISVGIKHSECFGLLGVNGAGKTTLFKMMTGDERISFGEAYVQGMSLKNSMNQIYQKIGYCPQFDALIEDLTGREVLTIFSLLRGVPEYKIKEISDNMANDFGFMMHIDKPVKTYSGGNKRKLSTSIALLGSPSIVYLDEPTTGMDPGARRQLWDVVCKIRDSGKSIVLTSHSMEECEALCTRLAIMVNGEFQCIGSTQHLKNKYSKGLILKIKLHMDDNGTHDESLSLLAIQTENIKLFVQREFSQAVLKEQYQGILTFYVPLVSIKWSKIFGTMERNKLDLNIEDYSISQTTLEEIFLEFALMQREDTRINQ